MCVVRVCTVVCVCNVIVAVLQLTVNALTSLRITGSLTIYIHTKVGTVWVNCWLVRDLNVPFGGAKMSGVGREGLKDSLEFYTEVKTVCIKH